MSERPRNPLVSVVLPVFNEAAVLPRLVTTLGEVLRDLEQRYELVFVDDGSTDGSAEILAEFAEVNPRIRLVRFSRNFGHQAAVQAGLDHAEGDAVVVMDSDMQDDPRAIGEFLEWWRDGYDVVYAVRKDRKEGLFKRWAFSTFYRVLSAVSEIPIPRDAGNFGLLDRRVVRAVASLGDGDRYFPGLRRWVGFRQIGIPVERLARYDEEPRVSFWGLVRLARTAIFSFSRAPLQLFYVLAGLLFVAALGTGLWATVQWATTSAGSLTLVVATCGLATSALNALGIAVLGEYVTRVHDQVRRRPLYVVDAPAPTGSREHVGEVEGEATRLLESIATLYDAPAAAAAPSEPWV